MARIRRHLAFWHLVPIAILVLAGMGAIHSAVLARDPKLRVVTTVAPHADLIREIAGSRVDLVQLIPDGTDSHTFEPRPSDVRSIADADLIVLNGLNLETPTQRLADANKRGDAQYLF